jgi:hypothetical protein
MSNEVDHPHNTNHRFLYLLIALGVLLLGYPWPQDTAFGAFLGGMMSLGLLIAGVYAVSTHRHAFIGAGILALAAATGSIVDVVQGVRSQPVVEGLFFLFYAFTTIVIFWEVIRTKQVEADTVRGIVCVYLLIGIAFGTLYDFIETIRPGSFVLDGVSYLGFRQLVYYSFMTLTTIGYGDITPATYQAQSLAAIEGVIGVLYVAVLVARVVGIYSSRPVEK